MDGLRKLAFVLASSKHGTMIVNRFDVHMINAQAGYGVGHQAGAMKIPSPNYTAHASFGSLELRQRANNEFIGQAINYTENTVEVRTLALDDIGAARVDFIKLDVEGMELEALQGAEKTVERSRPVLLIEKIKADAEQLTGWLRDRGYTTKDAGINILAIHSGDKILADINPKRAAK